MVPHVLYFVINTVQTFLGVAVLCLLIRAKELRSYWPLLVLAIWQAPSYFILLYVRQFGPGHISAHHAYLLYFYSSWMLFGVSAVCSLLFTYVLFRNAMRPLKGLQSLGNIVFSWVAFISTLTTLAVASAPSPGGSDKLVLALVQLERASALITISLVAFVAMAIRPMGLSVQSRIFGASIGTLIVAVTNAAESTYVTHELRLFDRTRIIQMVSSCIALLIWIWYFVRPEPERKFILLPTTSPFHHWNQISEMLGHEPGFVAIGGVAPENFAGAEVEVFRRASAKMKQIETEREQQGTLTGGVPH